MMNPSNEDFMEDDPLAASPQASEEQLLSGVEGRMRQRVGRVRDAAATATQQTRRAAANARERTEFFLRENPIPTILGALALGLAVGLVIRYARAEEEKRQLEIKTPLGNLNWGTLSLPFLWPFIKSMKKNYSRSSDAVKDGVDRLRDVDLKDYAKPLRKRWKSWID